MKVLKNYAPILTQGFGVNGHLGNDIVGKGTSYNVLDTIVSCFKGTIIEVRNNCRGFEGGGSYGNYVLIDHNNGYKTRYAHLESVKVWVGQVVEQNQELGFMGNTGTSYGGHLHFEVIHNGSVIDPYDFVFNGKTFEVKPITLPTTHIVVSGDTVAKICRKYYGVADDSHFNLIKRVNGLNDNYLIVVGQQLTIPIYEEVKPIEPPKDEEKPIEENNDNKPIEQPKEEITEVIEDKPIKAIEPIKTSIWVELFKFIIKFVKEMFKK